MKKRFLFAIASVFLLFQIHAKDKILSPDVSQEKFIQYMKKNNWILVEEKLNGKEFVDNKIKEYKNYFQGIWNFDGYDNLNSSFCGFSCKILSVTFLAGYLSEIYFFAEDKNSILNLQKEKFVQNNNLLLETNNSNESVYYTADGNEFIFVKDDNKLTVHYKINSKNTYYTRKLKN